MEVSGSPGLFSELLDLGLGSGLAVDCWQWSGGTEHRGERPAS